MYRTTIFTYFSYGMVAWCVSSLKKALYEDKMGCYRFSDVF